MINNLNEAIKYCEGMADEQDMKAGFETDNQTYIMSEIERKRYRECAEEHRMLTKLLKELKQLREQTKWVPVSSGKLPKFGEKVLVHITNIDGIKYDVACLKDTKHAAYDGDYYWEGKFAYGLKDVIEWKPIKGNSENPNGWIPITEKLPEENDTYEVTLRGISELEGVTEIAYATWLNNNWLYHDVDDWQYKEVIAWKTRTQPYKVENEE